MITIPNISFVLAMTALASIFLYIFFELYTSYRKYLNFYIGNELEKILDVEEGVVEKTLLREIREIAISEKDLGRNRKIELAKHIVYLSLFNAIDYRVLESFAKDLHLLVDEQPNSRRKFIYRVFKDVSSEVDLVLKETIAKLTKKIDEDTNFLDRSAFYMMRRKRVIQHSAEAILSSIAQER